MKMKINNNFNLAIQILILLNVVAIILESFKELRLKYHEYFFWFEVFSVMIFTVEYFLRIWNAYIENKQKNKFRSVIKYIFSILAIIDLIAILPFYLPLLIPFDLRFVRILRMVRLLRILKFNRYSNSLKLLADVIKDKKTDLTITIFITFLLLLFASTMMYYVETDIQPELFPDILSSFWWAIATLTTVGYGDIYPITSMGKFIAGIIALLGIGLVALPTGILSSAFIERINKNKKNHKFCPHCGEKID